MGRVKHTHYDFVRVHYDFYRVPNQIVSLGIQIVYVTGSGSSAVLDRWFQLLYFAAAALLRLCVR
jgi:hypothetical protein